jgi:hypothetical protein
MANPVCIAPTNEPNTCRVCGKKLTSSWIFSTPLAPNEATEEQLRVWPRNPVWVTHENTNTAAFHGVYFGDHQYAYLPSEDKGLNSQWGNYRKHTDIGDGHFCSTRCAISFARIAANAGLRIPSVTRTQRRELRRNHKAIMALCPEILDPEPRAVPSTWTIKREGTLTPRGKQRFRHSGPELWNYRSGKLYRSKWDSGGIGTRVEDKDAAHPTSLALPPSLRSQLGNG